MLLDDELASARSNVGIDLDSTRLIDQRVATADAWIVPQQSEIAAIRSVDMGRVDNRDSMLASRRQSRVELR